MKKTRVLVVDDNLLNLKVASRLLKNYNLQVETVESGQECIDKIIAGEKYDLILMDDMMPRLSGVNTLKKLKEIASKLDLSGLNEFIAYEPLYLKFSEIPENSYLELVFIINNSNCPDNEVFDNWWDFVDFLRNIGKNLEVHIAEAMDDDDLCDLTLNDLIR